MPSASRPPARAASALILNWRCLSYSLVAYTGGAGSPPRELAELGLRLVRQAVLDGVPDQLDPVVQLQLSERVLHVVLHGAVRQYQPGGDLLVGQAGGDHAEDLGLALGQLPRRGVPVVPGRSRGQAPELAEHEGGEPRGEDRVAGG